jgi:hypothetical protein
MFDHYFSENPQAFECYDDACLFEDATDAERANPARLITFKLNSKGQIRSFEKLDATAKSFDGDEYNESTNSIVGAILEEDIVIFNVSGWEAEYACVWDISMLQDEGRYSGCVLANEKERNATMIVTNYELSFSKSETSFAVATKVSLAKDADDNDVLKVNYYCNEDEGFAIFDDMSASVSRADMEDISVGSVFAFIADKEGRVTYYAVIGTIDEGVFVCHEDGIRVVCDEETTFLCGSIANDKKILRQDGEIIRLDSGELFLVNDKTTNKYTYDDSGRTLRITTGGFMEHPDMDYYSEKHGYTSKVFVKLVDDMVTDIYGFCNYERN